MRDPVHALLYVGLIAAAFASPRIADMAARHQFATTPNAGRHMFEQPRRRDEWHVNGAVTRLTGLTYLGVGTHENDAVACARNGHASAALLREALKCVYCVGNLTESVTPADRRVAITVDDLPGATESMPELAVTTDSLLRTLRFFAAPAVGFVNEGQIQQEPQKIEVLKAWLRAGHNLGNHTFSHRSLNTTHPDTFTADVLRGERLLRSLAPKYGQQVRWFRHPYLHTGTDMHVRRAFESFLGKHGYTVAPVTIDNDEWVYAAAYHAAHTRGDTSAQRRIGKDYVRYMMEVFAFYEELSIRLYGREIPQVLLVHANRLNADWLDDLLAATRARGYRFITLEEALQDPVYRGRDTYIGPRGLSWLQRWAIRDGKEPGTQPSASTWVNAATRQ